jgi:hypothetical protein
MLVRYEIRTSSLEETLILLLMFPSLGTEVSSPVCTTCAAGSVVCAITADPAVDAAAATTAAAGTVFAVVSTAADIVDDTTTVGDDTGTSTAGGGTVDDADELNTGLYRLLMAAAPDNTALFDADDRVELVFSVGAIPAEEELAVRAVPAVVPAA